MTSSPMSSDLVYGLRARSSLNSRGVYQGRPSKKWTKLYAHKPNALSSWSRRSLSSNAQSTHCSNYFVHGPRSTTTAAYSPSPYIFLCERFLPSPLS